MLDLTCTIFLALLVRATQAANSEFLEVDLIFPRNETYAPMGLMPIVFAVQNPALAPPLDLSVYWRLQPQDNRTFDGGQRDLSYIKSTAGANPYLATFHTNTLLSVEGTWLFSWSTTTFNCTQNASQPTFTEQNENSLIFSTRKNSQLPNLETSSANCSIAQGLALNVTAEVAVNPQGFNRHRSCALLGPPLTTSNPCAVTLDSAAASSISAEISLSASWATQSPSAGFSWPTATAHKSAASSARLGADYIFGRWTIVIVCVVVVLYALLT